MEHPPEALSQTINNSWQALLNSFLRPEASIEMLCIAGAVTLAWLMAFFLRALITRHLQRHPLHSFSHQLILRPLALLTPLLTLFMLSLARPFIQHAISNGELTHAAMQLAVAATAARIVLLLVQSRAVALFIAIVIMLIAVLDVTGFMEPSRMALESVAFTFGKFRLSMLGLAQGIIILVIVFWGANSLSNTLENYLQKSSRMAYNTRELIVKFFKIFVYCTAFLITLSAMGIDLTALAIFGGALGVGIGLGLQKITANFVSGITLLIEKSIKIGDLIEVNNTTGWVRQLNIRYALVETFDGRELLIPNEILVSTQVTNWTYTTDAARVEFTVGVAYDSDVELVKKLALEAVREHPMHIETPAPTCHLREFGDSSLNFLITFWIADIREGRYTPQSDVMISLLKKFTTHGISIPFPQRTVSLIDDAEKLRTIRT